MTVFLLVASLLAAPDIRVSITPDQPLPFAYMDEPLIVEVSSPSEKQATVRVDIDGSKGSVVSYDLGPIDLSKSDDLWRALKPVELPRDRYRARFTIGAGGVTFRREEAFCRIDRPEPGFNFPLSVQADSTARENLALALAAIPGRAIRLEADAPDLEARIDSAREAGLQAVVGLRLGRMAEPAVAAEGLATKLGDRVARWDVDGAETPAVVAAVAETLHRGHPRAGIGLVARDAEALTRLLDAGAGQHASAIVFEDSAPEPGGLLALRSASERAGIEGLSLVSLSRGIDRGALIEQGQWLVKQAVLSLSVGAESVVNSELVLNPQGFGDPYVNLSGMAHRLRDMAYAGELDMCEGVRVLAFRKAERWVLVLWAKAGPQNAALRLAGVSELALTDARNNPLALPALDGDILAFRVGPEPMYLSGKGGSLAADAARRMASEEALAVLGIKDAAKRLPAELVEMLRIVSEKGPNALDRRGFLALTSMFSALEQARQSEKLPSPIAVPASAGLGRLLRHLCVLEEARGEPFLEPLQEMLAKCSGYASKYLTGASNGDVHNRQDWLLSEVTRLMAEAKLLEEAGLATEAGAVAALAEGRARSLEYAAQASPAKS